MFPWPHGADTPNAGIKSPPTCGVEAMTTRAMIFGMLRLAFEIGAGSDFCPRCPRRDRWPDHRDLTTLIVVPRSPVSRRLLRGVSRRKQMDRQGFAILLGKARRGRRPVCPLVDKKRSLHR